MPSLRYLNTVLTLIAILLTLNLWSMWSGGPAGRMLAPESPAHAATQPMGIPNASLQRQRMVDLLKLLNRNTEELIRLFRTGKAKVKVDAPSKPIVPAGPQRKGN